MDSFLLPRVAQEGFEPSASLVLSESGLPVAYRATFQFRGLESNQRPPRSERGVTTSSNCPGVVMIREEGFEPPPPDSKSGSLPVSRFPRASCGSRTRLSAWEARAWPLGQRRLSIIAKRDRGFEPRSPGWKPGVVPLDQSRSVFMIKRKERESNPQGSSLARFRVGCRHQSACPSVIADRLATLECELRTATKAPAGGVEPPIVALTGRRLTVRPHRYRNRDGRI